MLDRKDWWTALWISWRHLRTKQRRAGLSFLTTVTIAGVCIGVAALIIVLSVNLDRMVWERWRLVE